MKTKHISQQEIPSSDKNPTPKAVTDALSWRNSGGSINGDVWWQSHLGRNEHEQLDDLLGLALVDEKVCEQLVIKLDLSLLAVFGFSEETQHQLAQVRAETLEEFAQAALAVCSPQYIRIHESV